MKFIVAKITFQVLCSNLQNKSLSVIVPKFNTLDICKHLKTKSVLRAPSRNFCVTNGIKNSIANAL